MLPEIKSLRSMKAGGGILDGSKKAFKTLIWATENTSDTLFWTVSAKKGVTNKLDALYERAINAQSTEQKDFVRDSLRVLCKEHQAIAWREILRLDTSKEIKLLATNKARFACEELLSGALEKLEELFKNGDPDRVHQANMQALGEQLNVRVLVKPHYEALGYLAIYLPATSFMRARRSDQGMHTNAVVDDEMSVGLCVQLLKECLGATIASGHEYKGVVVITEGFIATILGRALVTLGYDGSDLTACVIAKAIKLAGLSDTATVELLKNVDRPLWPSSLQRLRRKLRKEKHGLLVGLQALDYAIRNCVTIIVRDTTSGIGYKFGPKSSGWAKRI